MTYDRRDTKGIKRRWIRVEHQVLEGGGAEGGGREGEGEGKGGRARYSSTRCCLLLASTTRGKQQATPPSAFR